MGVKVHLYPTGGGEGGVRFRTSDLTTPCIQVGNPPPCGGEGSGLDQTNECFPCLRIDIISLLHISCNSQTCKPGWSMEKSCMRICRRPHQIL